ncbi:carbohydrate ABC transporter permease [Metabacillus arenae]|uniref:Carbohydrate ABC transporter permease n=1 Tax=Metabacillus arenae TaxID=2771434 RepID=A0A926NK70_9BACI|nr:carbohydrate ABC transporter permease [Metabacillus arenae]MBD1382275.1 carbohydrate ABC transporter permease [Metabacillus arenae]
MAKSEYSGIIGKLEMKKRGIKVVYWLLFSVMVLISAVCIFPPLWIMLSSLKDIKEFFTVPPTIIPQSFHPEKLWEAWNTLNFGRIYLNTIQYTAGVVVFTVIFNGLMGYFLSILKPKGSSLVMLLVLWTMLLPNTLGMVPVFKTIIDFPLLNLNFTNTYWPMWMMAGANAFVIIVFKSFFDGIPKALIEAARIDGCSVVGIFFRIILPLSKPVIIAVTILTITRAWEDFFWPYMVLKDESSWTVIVAIFNMKDIYPMDVQFIALTFAIIPPAIIFIFFQKYIMYGFNLSGIKG